jgi:hypothetical protein
MAQSRKNQSALRFAPVFWAVLICGMIVAASVGYVWQKRQIGDLSKQYLEKEAALKKLRDENVKLKNDLVVLLSPQVLDQKVKDLKLGLTPPQAAQIWRLAEPVEELDAPPAATPSTKTKRTGALASR